MTVFYSEIRKNKTGTASKERKDHGVKGELMEG